MNHKKPAKIMIKQLFSYSIIVASLIGMAPVLSAAAINQSHFDTAEQAANTMVDALAQRDTARLRSLFGDHYSALVPETLDDYNIKQFIAAWEHSHELLPQGERKRNLAVGRHKWVFPIPIAQGVKGWHFDTETGIDTIRIRQIGTNELFAIQSVLAYHNAQMEYAKSDFDGNGVLEYAQKFIGTPGQKNGLYWAAKPGDSLSPLGSLFAERTPEAAYHGYYYQILKGQGEYAQDGAYSYLVNDNMVQGFALIAWPAKYGESGIMSFMISREGVLFEADLGSKSDPASTITLFDTDAQWSPVSPNYTKLMAE
ncbi:MAG: DUF2950 domain-containing protein [Pseudomonadales bacterium]|nr:DUF2950 domain-containing protein [Pseudomonadales bacterium]